MWTEKAPGCRLVLSVNLNQHNAMNAHQNITPELRRRVVSAFYYFNPYALLDGERCNSWATLRADYRRALEQNDQYARKGFLQWLISSAAESEYCRAHDC